jgi:DNA-binding response OmpR family regulator
MYAEGVLVAIDGRTRTVVVKGSDVSKRVLIVEDENDVADLIGGVLDLEGYETRLAVGETAMDEALSFQPDQVLLDLMMPVVDGFEVARRMRARGETSSVPIVVMTAMHDPAGRAAEIGTPHYLSKPFDIDELLERVARIAGQG